MALADLTRARTRQEVVARMLTALGRPDLSGLPVTDWNSGGVTRTLCEISAEAIADAERTVAAIAQGGYVQTAQGEWLDELVLSEYDLTRQEATYARGEALLICAPGSGPYTIPPGLWIEAASGVRFSADSGGILPAGGTLAVRVRAEQPGDAYNVPTGTLSRLVTPLPGVSVTNTAGWLTEAGASRESDDALRARARRQWPALGGGMTRAAYEYAALTAHPAVQQALILDEHPRGQGTVDVVLWGAGGIGASVVAAVDAVVQARRPVGADVRVYAATERVVNVEASLYAPALSVDLRPAAETAIQVGFAELQRATGIGGRLYASQLIEVAMQPAGVLDARVNAGDVILGPLEGVTLAPTLTWRSTP